MRNSLKDSISLKCNYSSHIFTVVAFLYVDFLEGNIQYVYDE